MMQFKKMLAAYNTTWRFCLIAILVIIAYGNSLSGDFVLDDIQEIENNPRLMMPHGIIDAIFNGNGLPARPIAYLTFAANMLAFGTWRVPFHVVNLLLHLACAFLLYCIALRALRQFSSRIGTAEAAGSHELPALMAVLIWSVHPLNTQAVTYIYQRIELLVSFFALFTIQQFFRYRDTGSKLSYIASVASCGLGMLTKENMVVVPFLLAAWDFVESRETVGNFTRNRLSVLGLHFLTIVFLITTIYIQSDVYANTSSPIGRLEYFVLQNALQFWYVFMIFWPNNLSLHHESSLVALSWPTLISTVAVLVLWGITVWAFLRQQYVCLIGISFFGLLAPTSSVQPVLPLVMEHRPYLASFVVIFGSLLFIRTVYRRIKGTKEILPIDNAKTLLCSFACIVICTVLVGQTRRRNEDYLSRVGFWEQAYHLYPESPTILQNFGLCLVERGEGSMALGILLKAAEFDFDRFRTFNFLAMAYKELGRYEQARNALDESLRLKPGYAVAWMNYAALLRVEGLRTGTNGWNVEAREKYQRAWDIEPSYLAAFGLATLAAEEQDWQVAEVWYQNSLVHSPHDLDAMYNRAYALSRLGRIREADDLCVEMIRLYPSDRDALRLREQIKQVAVPQG
jgi:protein O-mannosyl-transferase